MSRKPISHDRWQQIKTILGQAAESPPEEREEALDPTCDGDAELRREVETFDELGATLGEGLEKEPSQIPGADRSGKKAPSQQGRRVGPYRIERVLGQGGMGTVFLASREGEFEQQVALKVVNWNLSQEEVLARFYNERQILARLTHPGIARLLDGGTTEDGVPYFAMEYVEGERIDLYCERRRLSLRQRLELFRKVCDAVHFAHQSLVVHRDLKMGNILVTEDGEPRLLDFGIAKLLQEDLASQVVATLPGQSPMTPAYASPEQLLNQPITTASDVYALGVLLYRLLSGHPPYLLEGKTYSQVVELACSLVPEKPSSRRRLGGDLDAGDLDAIVLKAMRKEPRHRYGSVAELSEDIRRHLVGLPVEARKGTWIYHSGKFVRRNKLALAAMLLIVAFAVSATFLWRQAVRQRTEAQLQQQPAERQRTRAQSVTDFLKNLFKSANPDANRGGMLTVREVLEEGKEKLAGDLEGEPEIRAEIFGVLGSVYRDLGLFEEAAELKGLALEVRRESDPSDRPDLAKDIFGLASALYAMGDYEGAEGYFRQALEMQRRLDPDDPDMGFFLFNLASVLAQRGESREAEALHREALEIRQRAYAPNDARVASSLYSLGALHRDRGDYEGAERLLRQALAIRVETLGPEHTKVAQILNSLGWTLHAKGAYQEARSLYEQALEIRRERLGEDHTSFARTEKNLAAVLLDVGQVEEAEALIESALATLKGALPEGDLTVAEGESILGGCLAAQGRYAEAEPLLLAGYRAIVEVRGEDAFAARWTRQRLDALYAAWQKHGAVAC